MKFYVLGRRDTVPKKAKRPYATLTKDSWNDFGYTTLFTLRYYPLGGETVEPGNVKIATLENKTTTVLAGEFTELDESYFSLGQAISYYATIRAIPLEQQRQLLIGLRDVVFDPSIAEKAAKRDVFSTSLLRFSEAVQAYRDGGALFSDEPPQERTDCSFQFTVKMKQAATPHVLTVLLGNNRLLPDRIMALIGKNGTGKTWLLGRLAAALSGDERNVGTFLPERPTFGRVIAVSYSAFDRFNKPGKRSFSYVFCSIYDKVGKFNTRQQLFRKIREAARIIVELERKDQWREMLIAVLDASVVHATEQYLYPDSDGLELTKLPGLSSGQLVLISTITELLAAIQQQSIVLFDEPELHQHPNSIAGLLAALHKVLSYYDSFAIVATHSPLVIQQIPTAYVRTFTRVENATTIREPTIECFGENLTTITQDVFQTNQSPSLYQTWLKLALGSLEEEDIVGLFPRGLSFNALSVLESLKQQ